MGLFVDEFDESLQCVVFIFVFAYSFCNILRLEIEIILYLQFEIRNAYVN